MALPRFGMSTHLFRTERLSRAHLGQIADHGFDAVELCAERPHFDYEDDRMASELTGWLADSHLELHSVHAPRFAPDASGAPGERLSIAAGDEQRRAAAVHAICATLDLARRVPFSFLIVHLGVLPTEAATGTDNRANAVRRSLDAIVEHASRLDVRVALEVMPNALSSPDGLVRLIEDELEGMPVGVCLDYGHAHVMGDLGEAIETVAGHLWTTHLHDNRGQRDEHLVPFAGTIDWGIAIVETQKVGFEGVLMLEVAGAGNPIDVLARSAKARARLEQAFITF